MLVLCTYAFSGPQNRRETATAMVKTLSSKQLHGDFKVHLAKDRAKWDDACDKARAIRGEFFREDDDGPSWRRPPEDAELIGYVPECGKAVF